VLLFIAQVQTNKWKTFHRETVSRVQLAVPTLNSHVSDEGNGVRRFNDGERELILNQMVLHMNKKAGMAEELHDILKQSEMSEK
jgi:hypothetical protein